MWKKHKLFIIAAVLIALGIGISIYFSYRPVQKQTVYYTLPKAERQFSPQILPRIFIPQRREPTVWEVLFNNLDKISSYVSTATGVAVAVVEIRNRKNKSKRKRT